MIINLDELNNSDNHEDGRPSNTLLHVMFLVLKILHVSNQQHPSTRSLKVARLFP